MLNERVSPQMLGAARILIFALWIVNVLPIHLEDLVALPAGSLVPHGVLILIPTPLWNSMWTVEFLIGFKVVLVGCLLWLVLGLPRYTLVAIAACVMLTLFDGLAKSLGHINHSKLALLFAAYILSVFPCTDAMALTRRPTRPAPDVMYVAPVLAVTCVLLLAYCFIGVHRLAWSGLGIFGSDAMNYWLLKRSYEANPTGFRIGILVVEHPDLLRLTKLAFAVTGLLEALSPLCLVSRWFRWVWMSAMIPFHVTTLLTMNIFFWPNIAMILLFVTDCDRLFARGTTPPPGSRGDGRAALQGE